MGKARLSARLARLPRAQDVWKQPARMARRAMPIATMEIRRLLNMGVLPPAPRGPAFPPGKEESEERTCVRMKDLHFYESQEKLSHSQCPLASTILFARNEFHLRGGEKAAVTSLLFPISFSG